MFKFLDKKWSETPLNRDKKRNIDAKLPSSNTLDSVHNMYDMIKFVKNFNHPEIKKYSKNTVIYDGSLNAKIMVIGESPSSEDDDCGLPFTGPAGTGLKSNLTELGLDLKQCYFTNVTFWKTPKGRKPTDDEIKICKPLLMKKIELINPKYILLLGASALQMFFDYQYTITKQRGKFLTFQNRVFFSTFHPSYTLRLPKFEALLKSDLSSFTKVVKTKI